MLKELLVKLEEVMTAKQLAEWRKKNRHSNTSYSLKRDLQHNSLLLSKEEDELKRKIGLGSSI